jgi:putative ABC transport system permease protein
MRRVRMWVVRLIGVLGGRSREREFARELESHLQLHTDDAVRTGMTREEARRHAVLALGGVEQTRERWREQRTVATLEHLMQDLRYGARVLRRNAGFTAIATLTLAVGVGANAAIFSVVNAVLLQPLPYPQAERLVLLWGDRPNEPRSQVSATDIADIRRDAHSFEEIATFSDWTPSVSGAGEAERINGIQVGDGFFTVMGVAPILGRPFTPEEQIEGNDRVIVLGHGLWQRKFGGEPHIVGTRVRMSGVEHEVVGVMPADFPSLPLTVLNALGEFYRPVAERYDNRERSSRHLRAIARLKPHVSLAAAQQEVDILSSRLAQQYKQTNAAYRIRLVPLHEDTVGNVRPTLLLLFGAVGAVLLVACANLVNLLLARSAARQPEIALRAAMGATGGRLVRQLLTEHLLLAGIGGAIGLGLASLTLQALNALALTALPQFATRPAVLDGWVLTFAVALTLLTTLGFGLVPALNARRTALANGIGAAGSRISAAGPLARALVVSEVALAVVLLFSAGLLVRSFGRLQAVSPGFAIENRLVMNVWLPWATYQEPRKNLSFYRELLRRVDAQPGITSSGLVSTLPFRSFDQRSIEVAGRPSRPGEIPTLDAYTVSPGYLHTMAVPVLEGRGFTRFDDEDAPPVVLINRTAARSLFPGESPVGKRLRFYDGRPDSQERWREIAGVVGDVRQYRLDVPPTMQVYAPQAQLPSTAMVLVVQTAGSPRAITDTIRRQIRELDSELAAFQIATLQELIADSLATRRLTLALVGSFAGLALLLGAIGIYGVISHWVTRRTREMAIRVALGGRPRQVQRLVMGVGLKLTAVGALAGAGIGLAVSRTLAPHLFEVTPADPPTLVGAVSILLASAVLATYVPARRATRVDPVTHLRAE